MPPYLYKKMCLNVSKIDKYGKYKTDTYKGKIGDHFHVETWQKCGHCVECMNEKANNWTIRNTYECKKHEAKCFITLTYEKNPKILIKKDLQDFIKRLRKQLEKTDTQIRYFACGEYGTKKGRPHYHMIIYGWNDKKAEYIGLNKKGNMILKSKLIEKCWGKGRTTYQEFNNKEIPYIALYNSPNDTYKKPTVIAKEKYREILNQKYKNTKELTKQIEKLEKCQAEFISIKEFNIWSIGLGFEEWLKDYESVKQTWTEYIEDKEFLTPTPWIKKMAEYGLIEAIEEMKKRQKFEIDRAETTAQRKANKESKFATQENNKKLSWITEKDRLEDL